MKSYNIFFLGIILLFLVGCKNSDQLKCGNYDGKYGDICIFNHAAKVAEQNVTKAAEICNNMQEESDTSQCLWNVANKVIKNIQVLSKKQNINVSVEICGNITDSRWSGECFYNLAKNIVFKHPKRAFEICEHSQKYWSFPCYQYLFAQFEKIFSEPKELLSLCQSFKNKFLKKDCYNSLGAITGYRYNEDTDKAYKICRNIGKGYEKNCFAGFGASLGWYYPENYYADNLNKILDKCDNSPYPDICYIHFIDSYFTRFETNITKSIELCKQVDDTYADDCFIILISRLRDINTKNFNFSLCNNFDEKYKEVCYSALSYTIGKAINNVNLAKGVCNQLEEEYKYGCFEGFGGNNVTHFNYYLPSQFTRRANDCKQLNKEFIFSCYKGLSKPIFSDIYQYNLNMSYNICYLFEEEYRKPCFQGIGSSFSLRNVASEEDVCSDMCDGIEIRYKKDCYLGCWNELGNFAPSFLSKHCLTLENDEFKKECSKILNKSLSKLI